MQLTERLLSNLRFRQWWNYCFVDGVDHAKTLAQVADDSGLTGRYTFLIIVSAGLSLLGLLMPSVAVLIGAMLLSPLMNPIIGLGFGIATMDFVEIRRAAVALVVGSVIAIVLSIVFVAMSPVQTITSEIAGRTQPTLFDLLVAFLSAIAGAYALIRGRGAAVVGVAIAIALMPPLAVVGFGIATWNWAVFSGALLLFITNAVVIALTAALTARLYGFGRHLSPHHTGWQLVLFFGALGALSVPLGAGLKQIAFEAVAQRQVRDAVRAYFPDGSRVSQLEIDTNTTPLRVRAVMLTPSLKPSADRDLEKELEDKFSREVDLQVNQVRTDIGGGAMDEAQLARAGLGGALATGEPRERAVKDLALIAGVAEGSVTADTTTRTVKATAAPLIGLGMVGYKALELRADRQIAGWSVHLVPPADTPLPDISVTQGVVDGTALDVASWASQRMARTVQVSGASEALRNAVVEGIVSRGGTARAGNPGGGLELSWVPEVVAPPAGLSPTTIGTVPPPPAAPR